MTSQLSHFSHIVRSLYFIIHPRGSARGSAQTAAEPFDLAAGRWAGTLSSEPLLVDAIKYVDEAKSCGFTGLVFLHGLLSTLKDDGIAWTPELLANEHPTYYGMLVAQFSRGISGSRGAQ